MVSDTGEGFYFLFCGKGGIHIHLEGTDSHHVRSLESSLLFKEGGKKLRFKPEARVDQQFYIIKFIKPDLPDKPYKNSLYFRLKEWLKARSLPPSFLFTGKPNVGIIKEFNSFRLRQDRNLIAEMALIGFIYDVFELKIYQMLRTKAKVHQNKHLLGKECLKKVLLITNSIRKDPSKNYTVSTLCQQNNMQPVDLQDGFKQLHGQTVNQFIKDQRLEESARLIRTSDLNISEIVYSIGLTNRSYFSKIFKQKYGCSPKVYRKKESEFKFL